MTRDLWLTPSSESIFDEHRRMRDRWTSLTPFSDSIFSQHRRIRHPWDNQLSLWDDKMFDIGSQIAAMQREIEATLRRFGLSDFKLNDSRLFSRDLMTPYIEAHTDADGRDTGKYTMSVPVGGIISPEDLKISLKDNTMCIEAKKEEKSADGTSRVYQEFVRKFTLPPNVDPKEVKSVLSPEGLLKIEAPLPRKALPEPRTRALEIPIIKE